MKLSIGLSAALSGLAAAAQHAAQVYILPATESASTTTHVSPSLARLVFLQRLAASGKGPSTHDIPDALDPEAAVSFINQYGKAVPQLFSKRDDAVPSQLVVMLEGMTDKQIKEAGESFEIKPAFTISNPPSSDAHANMIKYDFYNAGVTNEHECNVEQVVNPFEEECWSGKSTVAKYNIKKNPEVLDSLLKKFPKLASLAKSGEMETTLVLLPQGAGSSKWSDKSQELRRRQVQTETVMSLKDETESSASAAPTSSASNGPILAPPRGSIPSCFNSEDKCISATNNCSSQGTCINKYAPEDKVSCYACHCLATKTEQGSVIHWAGRACTKQDVSVQFWLFAGFTLLMVFILSMSIGMLFNVGQEKLPGVIGAGVSRNK